MENFTDEIICFDYSHKTLLHSCFLLISIIVFKVSAKNCLYFCLTTISVYQNQQIIIER